MIFIFKINFVIVFVTMMQQRDIPPNLRFPAAHPRRPRFCDALVECDPDFSAPVARRLFRTIAAVRPPDPGLS